MLKIPIGIQSLEITNVLITRQINGVKTEESEVDGFLHGNGTKGQMVKMLELCVANVEEDKEV